MKVWPALLTSARFARRSATMGNSSGLQRHSTAHNTGTTLQLRVSEDRLNMQRMTLAPEILAKHTISLSRAPKPPCAPISAPIPAALSTGLLETDISSVPALKNILTNPRATINTATPYQVHYVGLCLLFVHKIRINGPLCGLDQASFSEKGATPDPHHAGADSNGLAVACE